MQMVGRRVQKELGEAGVETTEEEEEWGQR